MAKVDWKQGTNDKGDFGFVLGDEGGWFFTWSDSAVKTLESLEPCEIDGDGGLTKDEAEEALGYYALRGVFEFTGEVKFDLGDREIAVDFEQDTNLDKFFLTIREDGEEIGTADYTYGENGGLENCDAPFTEREMEILSIDIGTVIYEDRKDKLKHKFISV